MFAMTRSVAYTRSRRVIRTEDRVNVFGRYLIEEFAEDYLEGRMDRRELLKRTLLITGSVTATAAVLTSLGCTPSAAPSVPPASGPAAGPAAPSQPTQPPAATATPVVGPDATVTPNDPAIVARAVQFPGKGTTVFGYYARPTQAGTYPGVIVIQENQGLVPHIEEVTRRIAKVGFAALAVDMVSRAGGTANAGDQAAISGFLGRANPDELTSDLISGIDWLKQQDGVRKTNFGVFGFCFGGGYAYRLAVSSQDIAAATPWYGIAPPLDQVPNLRGAIWAIYAANDARINASIPDLEAAMKANNKRFSYELFPDTGHGFHRSTDNPTHMTQAKIAWQKMVDFMTKELKTA
jgi:carboxymethylenebutenolidase